MKQEKHQASIMYLNICLMDRPEYHANAYLYIAINFRLLGNIRSSIKILEDGLRLFPVFEEGLFYKGKLHCKLKEYQEAKLCLERCHSLNPANSLSIYVII